MTHRSPRLVEVRRGRAPESVRVAPAPALSRGLPRLEWASVGGGWEEAAWLATAGYRRAIAGEDDVDTLAIELGTNHGAEPELCGGGSRPWSPRSGSGGAL
jgi:hypothetical protein